MLGVLPRVLFAGTNVDVLRPSWLSFDEFESAGRLMVMCSVGGKIETELGRFQCCTLTPRTVRISSRLVPPPKEIPRGGLGY